jgi:hypothetical protein
VHVHYIRLEQEEERRRKKMGGILGKQGKGGEGRGGRGGCVCGYLQMLACWSKLRRRDS